MFFKKYIYSFSLFVYNKYFADFLKSHTYVNIIKLLIFNIKILYY